jgi:hypothetical protein
MTAQTIDPATYNNIITQIDNYYQHAWNMLIYYGIGIFVVVGIIFPYVFQRFIQWQQEISFKGREKDIKEALKELLINDIDRKFKDKTDELTEQMEKIKSKALAVGLHIQGQSQIKDKLFVPALDSYIDCASHYLYCGDLVNLTAIMENIEVIIHYDISYNDLSKLEKTKKVPLTTVITDIENSDFGGAYALLISKIKENVYNLKQKSEKEPELPI